MRCRNYLLLLPALLGAALVPAQARPQAGDGVAARRLEMLSREQARPFPRLVTDPKHPSFYLSHLNLALADFELGQDAAGANGLVQDAMTALAARQSPNAGSSDADADAPDGRDVFHFELAQYLFRIERMFGPAGTAAPGRLTNENRVRMAALFYGWARTHCPIAVPRAMRSWDIWGSENHGAQRDSACWAAATLLAGMPDFAQKRYADGSLPAEQLKGWTGFLRQYLSERGTHGTLVEYFSPTYTPYTLNNFYLYADFSADAELKRLATASLDLWWALWSQEQLGGLHGGSETRRYGSVVATGTPMSVAAWLYFGLGPKPPALAPGESGAYASDYRPPDVVANVAQDAAGRGSYDVWTRAPGLSSPDAAISAKRDPDGAALYYVDSRHNGILRFAHVTPGYVMGTAMVSLLPVRAWTAISAQNRWTGLVFAGGDPAARIAPSFAAPNGHKIYDGLFGVQKGGLQLVRSMLGSDDKSGSRLQVWFGAPVKSVDAQGWVFVDGPAFVAARPAQGGWHWSPAKDGRWLVPDDPGTAIVMQAADRRDYPDLQAFMAAVGRMSIASSPQAVRVTGLGSTGTVSLGLGDNGTFQIDGRAVDLQPPYIFKSPFVNESAGDSVVHVAKDGQSLDLDFRVHR